MSQCRSSRRLLMLRLPLVAACVAALAACGVHFSTGVEAQDTWTRSYEVTAGATLDVRGTNGKIRVIAGEGDRIDVTATRIAKGATEEAAKAALAEVTINERASADRVELDSSTRGLQISLGQSRTVNYDIIVPRSVHVAVKTTNGDVELLDLGGTVRVEGVNGRVRGRGLTQEVDITTVNGVITLDLDAVAAAGVRCRTTNGQIVVTLPSDQRATLAARVTNGTVRTEGLTMTATEESRRRLDATIGGGGPEIRLETTNGEVRISGR